MKRWIIVVLLLMMAVPAFAAGRLVQVQIVDSATGQRLQVHYHHGRYYVAGTPGREYAIRLRNRTHADLLAVVSVDGVNVVSGETAGVDQGGYILGRRQRFDVRGWRKSLERVASFYFSSVDASYAAQTGRRDNVGVIGVAVFKRQVRPKAYDQLGGIKERADAAAESAAPHAPGVRRESEDEAGLGTGHGRRQSSIVRYGEFERASETPDEIVTLYYDSRANLITRGVIPGAPPHPDPFPHDFVHF